LCCLRHRLRIQKPAEVGAAGDSPGVVDHDGIKSRIDVPAPCNYKPTDQCDVAIANEYIAMRFGAYVRYVILQLKNLMTFMSIGLLLFILATVSYPFREPPLDESEPWCNLFKQFVLQRMNTGDAN
jgi:hypothetical protein